MTIVVDADRNAGDRRVLEAVFHQSVSEHNRRFAASNTESRVDEGRKLFFRHDEVHRRERNFRRNDIRQDRAANRRFLGFSVDANNASACRSMWPAS